MRRTHVIALLLVLASAAASISFYAFLPERIATHWNASGQADGSMPRLGGVLVMPIVMAFLVGLFCIIPRIDPRKASFAAFRTVYDGLVVVLGLFLLVVQMQICSGPSASRSARSFGGAWSGLPLIAVVYLRSFLSGAAALVYEAAWVRSLGLIFGASFRGDFDSRGLPVVRGQWVVENRGVEPDIEVENAPHELLSGIDPQLERAIRCVMDELAARPPKKRHRPPYKEQ